MFLCRSKTAAAVCRAAAATGAYRHASSGPASSSSTVPLHLVECPRDAMQGLKNFVPTAHKIRFINQILKVGFETVDCGSFVSPTATPQMRDTPEVLAGLDMSNTKSKLLVVVANKKGAVTASEHPLVTYVGYPLSASETFQQKNTKRSIETAVEDLKEIKQICDKGGKTLVVYISMGFGNPYGDPYSPEIVNDLVAKMAKLGVKIISLADTVGVSQPELIHDLFTHVIPKYSDVEFGAHFHSGAMSAEDKLRAAIDAGCRRFDGALGGMGGCPFAKSSLTGNIATETIVDTLSHLKIPHKLDLEALHVASGIKDEIFGVGMRELVLATVLHDENAFLEMCLKHFRAADVDHIGFLGEEKFVESMRQAYVDLGEDAPPTAVLVKKFAETDVTGDGCITFDEYMVMVRRGLRKRLERKTLGQA
jgi:hydroxymethylglutaryl-CoA lyase